MLKDKFINKPLWLLGILLFTCFSIYYFIILYLRVDTDIQPHAAIAYSFAVNHDKLTPNFLYFLLVALLAGFSKYSYLYYGASVLLISLAITSKYFLNKIYIEKYSAIEVNKPVVFLLSVMMLFIFCLPGLNILHEKTFYIGQLAPNVWHNSTVIFLMPFSIVLYFKTYEYILEDSHAKNLPPQILVLIILNVLIKPSFLFVLIPSAMLFWFFRTVNSSNYLKNAKKLTPFILGIIFIVIEYYIIYKLNYTSNVVDKDKNSGVIISPLEVWQHFSDSIPIAIFTSCFFPIVYILFSLGVVLKSKLVQFAGINYLLAVFIWALFAEDGYRKFHGNFYWQVVVAGYLLFFCLVINFTKDIKLNRLNITQQLVIGGSFLLHFGWGVLYWIKIIIFNGYS